MWCWTAEGVEQQFLCLPNWRRQRGREAAARRRRRLHFGACFMALLLREGSFLPLSCQSETLAAAGYSKKTMQRQRCSDNQLAFSLRTSRKQTVKT